MSKTIHYLAGLPRSGNTLLSSLLNQNPDFYSSPLSSLSEIIYRAHEVLLHEEQANRSLEDKERLKSIIHNMPQYYYKGIDEPIIFDREKAWGTPYNMQLIKYLINPNPKVLFTVRDITEIISSYILLNSEKMKNDFYNADFYPRFYLNEQDAFCEFIMRPGGDLDKVILSASSAINPDYKDNLHLIEYNDLVLNPEVTMEKIYDFLELKPFKHNFDKIKKLEEDFDEHIGFPKNMHEVRSKLGFSKNNAKEILSEYIYNKYSGMEFWRENSKIIAREM
jgi:sulfotransferase